MNKLLDYLRHIINQRPENRLIVVSLTGFFTAGFAIGLIIFGWWLWPVVYVNPTIAELKPVDQALYVKASADLYSYQRSEWRVRRELSAWNGDVVACQLAQQTTDMAEQARLVAAAYAVNGQGCLFGVNDD